MTKLNAGKTSILALTTVFAVASFLLGRSISSVSAAKDKVTICHATASSSNPYVTETVDLSSLGDGHGNHGVNPGDIIPPTAGTDFPNGNNWDATGQGIFNNGCNVPNPSPTATPVCTDDCPTPPPQFHSVCNKDLSCELVEGAGTNSCVTDKDCSQEGTPTPTPTPKGTPLSCGGDQHLNAGGTECVSFSQAGAPPGGGSPQGQVLGASTMAGTGSFASTAYLAIMALGGTISAFGIKKFAKASK